MDTLVRPSPQSTRSRFSILFLPSTLSISTSSFQESIKSGQVVTLLQSMFRRYMEKLLRSGIHFNKDGDRTDWEDSLTHTSHIRKEKTCFVKPETCNTVTACSILNQMAILQLVKREDSGSGQQHRNRKGPLQQNKENTEIKEVLQNQ